MLAIVIDRENYGNRNDERRSASSVKEPGISTVDANRRNLYFRRVIWDLRALAGSQDGVRHPVTPASALRLCSTPCPSLPRYDAPLLFLSSRHLRREDAKLSGYQVGPSFCGRSFNFIPSRRPLFYEPVTRSLRRASSPFRFAPLVLHPPPTMNEKQVVLLRLIILVFSFYSFFFY